MERTELTKKLNNGEFVISVQIDPPSAPVIGELEKNLDQLIKIGVNLFDINSSRRFSYSSIFLAQSLSCLGVRVLPHVTPRQRSVNSLVPEIVLSHNVYHIDDFLVITGDPFNKKPKIDFSAQNFTSTDSIRVLSTFNSVLRNILGLKVSLGAAVNQNEDDLTKEGRRVLAKEEAGVDFFMSQPVFNYEQTKELVNFYRQFSSKPMVVGIWPLIYESMVEKIKAGSIEGVVVPEDVYDQSKQQSDLRNWGLTQAGHLIEDLKHNPDIQGVYIVAPARNPLHLTDLLARVLT
ncbi:methylenetetrahydrofolate reductase [Candidatus Microgenomates bacterium]|nr:methylenetetrahydrofolate reductase [Candidatus Microgenomates bacterium]